MHSYKPGFTALLWLNKCTKKSCLYLSMSKDTCSALSPSRIIVLFLRVQAAPSRGGDTALGSLDSVDSGTVEWNSGMVEPRMNNY